MNIYWRYSYGTTSFRVGCRLAGVGDTGGGQLEDDVLGQLERDALQHALQREVQPGGSRGRGREERVAALQNVQTLKRVHGRLQPQHRPQSGCAATGFTTFNSKLAVDLIKPVSTLLLSIQQNP